MYHYRISILALFLYACCILDASAENPVFLAAQETETTIGPRAAQQRHANLPALTFDLRVAIDCPGEPEALTLSVSDTFRTLDKEDIGGRRSAETSLSVPSSQLALAASESFCIEDDTEEAADELVMPGFLTAFVSLRCTGQDGPSMHFASAPLQVRVKCERHPTETQEPSSNK